MQCKIYTLPEITFVGGKTQEIRFNLKDQDGTLYNVDHCVNVDFSICNYSLKTGTPLFSIIPEKVYDEVVQYPHMYKVVIPPELTKDLYGKFIYQITIEDATGRIEIPNQGIINITRNINQGFITS